ncbi:hypothetical protein EEY24_12560 [Shewanella algae]|nr:hypothetical protein EEY24_12560 [Shewanella algae]
MSREADMTKCVLMPLLIILLLSGAAYAVKADDAAIRILNNQLQLLALLPEGQEFADDLRSMSRGDLNLQLELREGIEQDIAAFWKRRGVPLAFNTLPLDANSLSRALALEPQEDDYLATSSRIRYLIWLAERHQWPRLDPGGWLRPGDSHLLIPTIAKRLYWLGDLSSEPGDNKVYSPQLASAVEAFQSRHGLKTDAIIGPDTLRWLNTEPLQRARMLAGNFVARTVYKQQLGKRYLLVNIPAFELTLVDDNQVQLRSRVIVGKPYRQTPLLSSEVSNIVLNPTWTVPRGILRRDLLPQIRKNGEYLQQRHFNVYDYQGNRVEESAEAWQKEASGRFPYRLVQQPGADNALGRYKFHFSNGFNVYLHDTPDKHLFAKANRALSSGCIRVDKVEELASWMANNLVRDKRTWQRMQSDYQTTQWFAFEQRLPVHLVYWTAWMDERERAQFRSDIYQLSPGVKVALGAQTIRNTELAHKAEQRQGREEHLLRP